MAIRQDLALADGRTTTALVRNSGRLTGAFFSTLGSWRDEDVPRYLKQITPVLDGAKAQVARSSIAFYQSVAQLTGQPFNRPVITASDLATKTLRNGVTSETVYRRPFVDLRRSLSNGSTMTDAITAGATRANLLAQTEIELAKRNVGLQIRRANDGIVGYIRTLTGGENCALCYVASTQRYHRGNLMPIHPGCDCGEMPLYGSDDPGQVIDAGRLEATHENVLARFGESDRAARQIDYRNIMIEDHGEMGPMLTWKKHNSTKLVDIAKKPLPLPDPAGGIAMEVTRNAGHTVILNEFTDDQGFAARRYSGSAYTEMNWYLRTGKLLKSAHEDTVQWIENLSASFGNARLTQTTQVTRGIFADAFGLEDVMANSILLPQLKALEGQILKEKGFLSTTTKPAGVFDRTVLIRFEAPEGMPALDMDAMGWGALGEKEIVFPPGTRYEITKVELKPENNRGSHRFEITARILKEGE